LSSTDPNLQNIPIRTPEGRRIRQAFVAPKGQVLLAADYSQIELRIMAHLSADKGLLKAFAKEQDVHRATAAEVFELALEASA
jgi:DNA polymerase-1